MTATFSKNAFFSCAKLDPSLAKAIICNTVILQYLQHNHGLKTVGIYCFLKRNSVVLLSSQVLFAINLMATASLFRYSVEAAAASCERIEPQNSSRSL